MATKKAPPRKNTDVIRCPNCGEEYSTTYKRCPFCDERPSGRSAPTIARSSREPNPLASASPAASASRSQKPCVFKNSRKCNILKKPCDADIAALSAEENTISGYAENGAKLFELDRDLYETKK